MANYDRRILVPYLQDVCSAECLCSHLENEIKNCDEDIYSFQQEVDRRVIDPKCPEESDFPVKEIGGDLPMVIIYGIIALIGLAIGWPILVIGAAIFAASGIISIYYNYQDRHNEYVHALEEYERRILNNRTIREMIPHYRRELASLQEFRGQLIKRLKDAQKLRDDVYGVNIIPARYRNIYAAYYLYDFFVSGRETDLERTLQTMLLDEIVQRLGAIIEQNEEILLNQRMQIAMQEQQNRMIAENHREQMRQIARVERNQELQMDYQNMIAQNQRVTNFFLAADYLRKT